MAEVYDLKSVKMPRMAGSVLKAFTAVLENPTGRAILLGSLLKNAGIDRLRQLEFDEAPTFLPTWPAAQNQPGESIALDSLAAAGENHPGQGFAFPSISDYAHAYREGRMTPEQVAQRVIDAVGAGNLAEPPLKAIIANDAADTLEQARASGQRYKQGKPLSIFDGVPVAVKDELDQPPYPTNVGTCFLGQSPAAQDATAVARLRAAGALLFGKANMHEIGIGVTGQNPHYGTPRNPYAPGHYTGGSSSGPAAAVAAGLCPVAVGADGGGSIRIPASFCGVIGLKATFGRVSEFGAYPLDWSVAHIGPLATTARDAALAYAVMAGPDSKDPISQNQPALTLAGFDNPDLAGFRIGVFRPWFEHATPEVVAVCREMLHIFENAGAKIVEIEIPDLDALRIAHVVAISSEMAASLDHFHARHHKDYSLETRLNLELARTFTSRDYIQAQRVRARAIANFKKVLAEVDVIATPSAGLTAPAIPLDALPLGESDLTTMTEIMRFAAAANLTGLPAISFPAGYDSAGLPVGFQAIGRPWCEHTLLRLANLAEKSVTRSKPQVYFSLLS